MADKYKVEFTTTVSVTVFVEADSEEVAADLAWGMADDYLRTVTGEGSEVLAEASIDGHNEDSIENLGEQ